VSKSGEKEENDSHSSGQFQLSPVKELHKEEDEESLLVSDNQQIDFFLYCLVPFNFCLLIEV